MLCSPTAAVTVLYAVVLGAFAVYFVSTWCAFKRVIKALKARPYHEVREARHNLNYQVRRHASSQGAALNASPTTDCQFVSCGTIRSGQTQAAALLTTGTPWVSAQRERAVRTVPGMHADPFAAGADIHGHDADELLP